MLLWIQSINLTWCHKHYIMALINLLLGIADQPRHVGDRQANDPRYLFLRIGII
jgi:hypothetical protein